MAQFSSFLAYCMFPLGTFPFSSVPELNHKLQNEVVYDVDLLCAYIPDLNQSVAASLCYEVISSPS
jgi:hypothetical protein